MPDEKQDGAAALPDEVAEIVRNRKRLAAVRGLELLDTDGDPDFDRLTELAASLMRTPIALVSLLGLEHQWFRSHRGIDLTGTPIGLSFCAHAIASDADMLIVPDATSDERFSTNSLVIGEHNVRFYAGAPIVVSGEKVGTICVLDRVPHETLDETQIAHMKALAGLASSLFALKMGARQGNIARAALVREEKRHALALEAASIASWVWSPSTDIIECDSLLPLLFNLPPAKTLLAGDFFRAIDKRDVTRTEARLKETLASSDDYSAEYRVKDTNPPKWLAARGRVIERDDNGNPALVFGVHFDVTERRTSDSRQRLLLREVNHRVKNTLATVQALATQTVRHSRDPRAFLEAFSSRLQALGSAHGLLSDHEWRGIRLLDLVEQQVAPFDDPAAPRISVNGEDVFLTPDQALALGLILHELASNALKYGSLSSPLGIAELSWTISRAEDAQRLSLLWKESGGPPVEPPQHQGFGSILIKRSLDKVLASRVEHDFAPDGVTATISLPLEEEAA